MTGLGYERMCIITSPFIGVLRVFSRYVRVIPLCPVSKLPKSTDAKAHYPLRIKVLPLTREPLPGIVLFRVGPLCPVIELQKSTNAKKHHLLNASRES